MKRNEKIPPSDLERIRAHIVEQGWHDGEKLPPRRYWVKALDISFAQVAASFRELVKAGIVTIVPRKGIFLGRTCQEDSSLALADAIKGSIAGGEYKAGHILPSYLELQRNYHVSPTTVAGAVSILVNRNLLHRKGKKYVVGSAPVEADFLVRRHIKHVVVVPPSSAYFERIQDQTSPYSEILRTFLHEVSPFAIDMHTVPLQGLGFDRTLRRGRTDIRAVQERLDSDIIATVYISTTSSENWNAEDIYSSLFFLAGFKRPVVWLDLDNLHKRDRRKLPPNVSVVGDCTVEAARALCQYLYSLGHRDLAFCLPYYQTVGGALLGDIMKDQWEKQGKDCQLRVHEGKGPWFFEKIDSLDYSHHKGIPFYTPRQDVLERIRERGLPFMRKFLSSRTQWKYIYRREAYLIENSPMLARVARDGNATCVVAPDGYSACVFRQWFRNVGVKVPKEMSVVGFGNLDYALTEGITTVGRYHAMGYALARLCIGDAPVKQRKSGAAVLNPVVNVRTSSSDPRSGSLLVTLDGDIGS